jgi:hypothetical protein
MGQISMDIHNIKKIEVFETMHFKNTIHFATKKIKITQLINGQENETEITIYSDNNEWQNLIPIFVNKEG